MNLLDFVAAHPVFTFFFGLFVLLPVLLAAFAIIAFIIESIFAMFQRKSK